MPFQKFDVHVGISIVSQAADFFTARWPTRSSAQRALCEYIEVWYNNKRLHASLGYKTPAQYESEMLNKVKAA